MIVFSQSYNLEHDKVGTVLVVVARCRTGRLTSGGRLVAYKVRPITTSASETGTPAEASRASRSANLSSADG